MKKIILIILIFVSYSIFAQKEIKSLKGHVYFEASVPLFEEVNAINETIQCSLNTKNGEITSIVSLKDFRFKLSLMEKHFNEKYLESDRYPKATFKGRIQGFNWNIMELLPKNSK